MIALLGGAGRGHGVVVLKEGRHELVGLTAVEAVPALETAPARPRVAPCRLMRLVVGGQVPLSDGDGDVPGGGQDLGEEAVGPRDDAVVPRKARRQVGNTTHAVGMVVASGEQAGPGRRAQRRRVEVGKADAAGGQAVEDGRVDVGTETAELGVTDVVEHDDDHVRRPRRGNRNRRPRRCRFPPRPPDAALEQ